MITLRFEAPLSWPDWPQQTPRTQQRSDHGFPTPLKLEEAIAYLDEEVKEIGATATLSLDIEQPLVERLKRKVGSRSGACLQMRWRGETYLLPCDRWQNLEHNIYALHLAIRHWRNIERWGVGAFSQLIRGFEISEGAEHHASALTSWMHEMGLGPTSTLEDAVAIYHRRAKNISHDEDALMRLNLLMDEVRAHFASKSE